MRKHKKRKHSNKKSKSNKNNKTRHEFGTKVTPSTRKQREKQEQHKEKARHKFGTKHINKTVQTKSKTEPKVTPKCSQMEPLGVPWAPLRGPWGLLGTAGASCLDFLFDFGSLFDRLWELNWTPKLIKMVSKNEVENSTEIK